MKKIASLSLALLLCISFWLSAVSCSSKHPIEEFKEKMEKAESYQMVLTMSDVPMLGTLTMTYQIDGNIQYEPATVFSEETYTQTVGDVVYVYEKNDSGVWTKAEANATEDADESDFDVTGDKTMEAFFNPENYEEVKGKKNSYQQKEDVTFEDFENVVITLSEDSFTAEMSVTSEGVTVDVKLVISKIGEIELTLPEVK